MSCINVRITVGHFDRFSILLFSIYSDFIRNQLSYMWIFDSPNKHSLH